MTQKIKHPPKLVYGVYDKNTNRLIREILTPSIKIAWRKLRSNEILRFHYSIK